MLDHVRMLDALNVLLAVACLAVGTYLLVDYLQGGSQGGPRGSEAPTTTPAPTTTTPAAKDAEDDKDLPTGAIAAIVIGALLVLVFLGVLVLGVRKRRQRRLQALKELVSKMVEEGKFVDEFNAHKEKNIDIATLLSKEVKVRSLRSYRNAVINRPSVEVKSLAEAIEAYDENFVVLGLGEEIEYAKRRYTKRKRTRRGW
jgi:HAMP domain-containing protein